MLTFAWSLDGKYISAVDKVAVAIFQSF